MPKRKDAPKRDDVPVRVDASVVRDARLVAAHRDVTLAEYVSDALREIVARDLREVEQDLAARHAKAPKPKRGGGQSQ